MSAFGDVPRASVCPCARCVEANMSPSSIASQTPTSTASWPIATCRKPGSSPARNRSSTFSSKRRIRSISRRKSRSVSSFRARFFSTLAKAPAVYGLNHERRAAVGSHWIRVAGHVGARVAAARTARPHSRRRGRCSAGADRPVPRLGDDPAVLGRTRRERSRTPRRSQNFSRASRSARFRSRIRRPRPSPSSAKSPRSPSPGTPRSPVCPPTGATSTPRSSSPRATTSSPRRCSASR